MTGKTHQIIGITAGLATYVYLFPVIYSPATFGAALVAAHLGALLPDIDQPTSRLWRSLPFGRVGGEIADIFLDHRNITHSLFGFLLVAWGFGAVLGLFPTYWDVHVDVVWIVGLVSYASHLLADAVTVEGIPLFFPYQRMVGFPPHPFAGIRILTGQWFENLVVFPLANLSFILLLVIEWSSIKAILLQ